MENQKSQIRLDMESRIKNAKSHSQALRFAAFELYNAKAKLETPPFDFEKAYEQMISDMIDEILQQAEKVHEKKAS